MMGFQWKLLLSLLVSMARSKGLELFAVAPSQAQTFPVTQDFTELMPLFWEPL